MRARYVTERTLILDGIALTIGTADSVVVCLHLVCCVRPVSRGRVLSFRQSHAATAVSVRWFTHAAIVLSRALQYTRVDILDALVDL